MQAQSDWRDIFCGREHELSLLEAAYLRAAAGSGPELAVVLGDRGMGKTRLVQELYRRLTTRHDPNEYWPDALLFKGNNLRVAPELTEPQTRAHFSQVRLDHRKMPFLWWGLRIADPLDRNAIQADLATHRRTLDPHLGGLVRARRLAESDAELKGTALEVGKALATKLVEMVPVVGAAAALAIEGGGMLAAGAKARRARAELDGWQTPKDVAAVEELASADLLSLTIDDVSMVLAGTAGQRTPVVLFCDDAQFARAQGDEGALRLLLELWDRAAGNRWPLLLVATHWPAEWARDADAEALSFARVFSRAAFARGAGQLLELRPEPALAELARAGLENLDDEDLTLLLEKADGNPQLLIELVDLTRRSPAWRRDKGGLTPHGRNQIRAHAGDLKQLILERLTSDVTPADVRIAIALSALQGMRFVCELTVATATALQLSAERKSLDAAESPHRLVSGVSEGVAHFVQRAYQEAGEALLGSHVGDSSEARAAMLTAALALMDDAESWARLSKPEQTALLGAFVALGEKTPDPALARRVGEALLILVHAALNDPQGSDYAHAAQLAQRFLAGLNQRWYPRDFPAERLHDAFVAITTWHDEAEGESLARILLSRARERLLEEPSATVRRELVLALVCLVSSLTTRGEWAEAERLCRESVDVARSLVRELQTAQAGRDFYVCLHCLATLAETAGRWFEVEALYLEALGVQRWMIGTLGIRGAAQDLATCLQLLGKVSQTTGRWAEAEQRYQESLEIFRQFRAHADTPKARRDVAMNLVSLATVRQRQGRLDAANALYREALAIARELADELGTPLARRDLSLALAVQADVALDLGSLEEAERFLREAVAISRELTAAPGTARDRRSLTVALAKLGGVTQRTKRLAETEACYRESAEICRTLAAQQATPKARGDLAMSLVTLGEFLHERGQQAEAGELLRESIELHRRVLEQLGTPAARRGLAVALATAARLGDAENPGQTAGLLEESLELSRMVSLQLDSPDEHRDMAVTLDLLAHVEKRRQRVEQSKALLRESLSWRHRVLEKMSNARTSAELATTLLRLATALEETGDLDEAEALYRQHAALLRGAVSLTNSPQSRRALALALEYIPRVQSRRGRHTDAESFQQEALALCRELAKELGTAEARRDLLLALGNMGLGAMVRRDWTGAQAFQEEAMKLASALARELRTESANADAVRLATHVNQREWSKRHWESLQGLHSELIAADRAAENWLDEGAWFKQALESIPGRPGSFEQRAVFHFEQLLELSREQAPQSAAHARISWLASHFLAEMLCSRLAPGDLERAFELWIACLLEGEAAIEKEPDELKTPSLMLEMLASLRPRLEKSTDEGDSARARAAHASTVTFSAQVLRLDRNNPRARTAIVKALGYLRQALGSHWQDVPQGSSPVLPQSDRALLFKLLDLCGPLETAKALNDAGRDAFARLLLLSLMVKRPDAPDDEDAEPRARRCLAILDDLSAAQPDAFVAMEPVRAMLRETLEAAELERRPLA